jgi:hypothetical protein
MLGWGSGYKALIADAFPSLPALKNILYDYLVVSGLLRCPITVAQTPVPTEETLETIQI